MPDQVRHDDKKAFMDRLYVVHKKDQPGKAGWSFCCY